MSEDAQMHESAAVVAFGAYELDFERSELRRDGQAVEIQRTPLRVLLYLAEHRDRTVSRAELLDTLWPGVVVGDEALSTALLHARQAVGDDGARQRVIRTHKGRGYRFVAETAARTSRTAAPGGIFRRRFGRVAVALVVLSISGLALWREGEERKPEPRRLVVALLPLANLSGDGPTQQYADGLTEEIGQAIEDAPHIEVVRGAPANVKMDPREVGRQLDATHVLAGSVRTSAGHTRASVRLASVQTGTQLWSRSFARGDRDSFLDQEVIAQQITGVLSYLGAAAAANAGLAQTPGEAELVRGMHLFAADWRPADTLQSAEQVLRRNPDNWVAHYVATIMSLDLAERGGLPRERALSSAERHAREVLRLAPDDPHSRSADAAVHLANWRWEAAEATGREACARAPSAFDVCYPLVATLLSTGQVREALEVQQRVVATDTSEPGSRTWLSVALFSNGRTEEAERECARANEIASGAIDLCGYFSWALQRREEAAATLIRAYEAQGLLRLASRLARLRAKGGPEAVWRGVAESRAPEESTNAPYYRRAIFLAQIGDNDAALDALERSAAAREQLLGVVMFSPSLESIREDPRFRAILAGMGLGTYYAEYPPPAFGRRDGT